MQSNKEDVRLQRGGGAAERNATRRAAVNTRGKRVEAARPLCQQRGRARAVHSDTDERCTHHAAGEAKALEEAGEEARQRGGDGARALRAVQLLQQCTTAYARWLCNSVQQRTHDGYATVYNSVRTMLFDQVRSSGDGGVPGVSA